MSVLYVSRWPPPPSSSDQNTTSSAPSVAPRCLVSRVQGEVLWGALEAQVRLAEKAVEELEELRKERAEVLGERNVQ